MRRLRPWLELRRRLHDLGLESFVKATGGEGLHVVAPIDRGIAWPDFKVFTQAVVEAMEHDEPACYTTNMAKVRRRGKIFPDHLRNGRGATFLAPDSPPWKTIGHVQQAITTSAWRARGGKPA